MEKSSQVGDIPGRWSGYVEGVQTEHLPGCRRVIFPADGRATLKVSWRGAGIGQALG